MNYTEPTKNVEPGGLIRFFKGLGLSRENTFYFATKAHQSSFFAEKASDTIRYNDGTTNSPTMAIKSPFVRTFALPLNSSELFGYDYVEVTPDVNADGSMGKQLYMFITGIRYVNERVAVITCELDVIQTFMFDWSLGTQSVSQMHSAEIYPKFSEELKTPEKVTPRATEVCKTARRDYDQTNNEGYLVVATEAPYKLTLDGGVQAYWYGWSAKYSVVALEFQKSVPISTKDGSQFVYTYVQATAGKSAVENLTSLLWFYNADDKQSAIKKIVACPPMLQGKDARDDDVVWVSPTSGTSLGKPDFSAYETEFPGCTPVVVDITERRLSVTAPTSMLGYTPNDPKTFNLLELEMATPTGEYIRLGTDDLTMETQQITLAGITGSDPEILIYPSVASYAALPNSDGTVKSYRVPVVSLANFPSYAIYDSDRQELFETQQTIRELGAMANFISKAAAFGGKAVVG